MDARSTSSSASRTNRPRHRVTKRLCGPMIALFVAVLVLVSDQAAKLLLHRLIDSHPLPLWPLGAVRMVAGRLWLRRLGLRCRDRQLWCLWTGAAVSLLVVSTLLPSSAAFVRLLLGCSLSHSIESSMHGEVAD